MQGNQSIKNANTSGKGRRECGKAIYTYHKGYTGGTTTKKYWIFEPIDDKCSVAEVQNSSLGRRRISRMHVKGRGRTKSIMSSTAVKPMPGSVQRDVNPGVANPTPRRLNSSLHSVSAEHPGARVEAVAYRMWQERGCPEGSADEIWFEAERTVRGN